MSTHHFHTLRRNKDTGAFEPETLPIPEGKTWIDAIEEDLPGFTKALAETIRWRLPRCELVVLPNGETIYPDGKRIGGKQ